MKYKNVYSKVSHIKKLDQSQTPPESFRFDSEKLTPHEYAQIGQQLYEASQRWRGLKRNLEDMRLAETSPSEIDAINQVIREHDEELQSSVNLFLQMAQFVLLFN